MPYISPALSPTRSFASPTSSGASSPGRKESYSSAASSGSTTPALSYVDGVPSPSANGSSEQELFSAPQAFAPYDATKAAPPKRPSHRHHSRSHSSDALVALPANLASPSSPSCEPSASSSTITRPPLYNRHSKSSKMTPDYIFVQPASPGTEQANPSASVSQSSSSSSNQPSSPTPPSSLSAANNGTGNVNGEYYQSLPSSSSGRSRSHHHYHHPATPSTSSDAHTASSSTRPSARRSSYNRQSASAVFGDYYSSYHSGPTSPPMSSTAGDEGDVPPPRSSSSSNLSSSLAHGGAYASASERRRQYRRAVSASADSSPRQSVSFTPLARINSSDVAGEQQYIGSSDNSYAGATASAPTSPGHARFAQAHRQMARSQQSVPMQASISDSALGTSSSSAGSSANSSFNNSSEESGADEAAVERIALSSALLQKHKPSWGEIPTPPSLSGATSFSFGQKSSLTSVGETEEPENGGDGSSDPPHLGDIGRGDSSGSSTPTPKAERPDPNSSSHAPVVSKASSAASVNLSNSPTAVKVRELQHEFVHAQPSTKPNGVHVLGLTMSDSPLSGSGSSSPTSASGSGSSATPTSGPLAPAATAVKRRPHHPKAFSERAESPFRLEFESNNHHHQNQPHSTHSRMTGLGRHREGSLEGSNVNDGSTPHFAHGGLTVHTHPPVPSAFRDHYHSHHQSGVHAPRSSSYRPSPLPTPMLRKKSGELVKSSMKHDSRAKSAPATPTGPKAVHFDEQLERVKLFLAQQKPTAVSRDGSPVETETEDDSEAGAFPFPPMTTSIPAQITLVLPDFNKNMLPDLGNRDLCLESLEIAADSRSLKGTALLRNLAFEKRLSVRFTFDDWQTVSEVTGEWQSTLNGGQIDRWSFRIKLDDMLARIEDKKLFLALKYTVAGREIWDSNNGNNYRAEFKKQAARSQAVVGGSRAARHEWAVTNAGQANERMADLRKQLDRLVAGHEDDDFSSADELLISANGGHAAAFTQGGLSTGGKGGAGSYKYQHRFLGGEAVPLAQAPASNTFSSRYDFGASLKQAASSASPASSAQNLPATGSSTVMSSSLGTALGSSKQAQLATSQQQQRGSPQSSHAILDNPYFAAPNASEAMINSWRNAANALSPSPASQHSSTLVPAPSPLSISTGPNDLLSPNAPHHQKLYADADDHAAPLRMTSSIIGGMPATTFLPTSADASLSTPPASFSGSSYYPRTEADGVVSQDFGLPNLLSYMGIGTGANLGGHQQLARERSNSNASSPRTEVPSSASSTASTATPGSYFPLGDPISSSTNSSATNSTTPSVEHSPTADFAGGAPLVRQGRLVSFPSTGTFVKEVEGTSSSVPSTAGHAKGHSLRPHGHVVGDSAVSGNGANGSNNKLPMFLHQGQRQSSGSLLAEMLDASLMDSSIDPRDTSIYSPAISPRSTSPPISSSAEIPGVHQRRHSPPPRPTSPDDLLSPSPSSASTDTSISTPQSPGGSPPLRMYSPFIASANGGGGRPEMGSDTYFNFVHRYCWGNGDPTSSSSSSSSTSTALGLAGLNPAYEAPTPRRITPPAACSASLLSSPTQSQPGSRTPSPKNGSPSLETVQRMEAKGYMSGAPPVQI